MICCQEAKPPLTAQRKKIITKYLKDHDVHVETPFIEEAYSFPALDERGFCVFHSKETGKCLVHEVKPETCRAGPVTFDINLKTGKIEWFLKKPEICALAGTLQQESSALENHFEVARTEILRLIRELDPKALRAILTIDEPQTFKIREDNVQTNILKKLGSNPSDNPSRRNH
jgi:Fe-S-cluster containining protein